ncbi:MAG: hypothetical protein EXS60_00300 [Candidatus Pacebacteria bacterium]|nr:hypothetical protein [Candidatus Paceibacterota bacterium]
MKSANPSVRIIHYQLSTKNYVMISWMSPEFHYHEKDEAWPVFTALLGIAFAAYALWQHNFLFFVFALIATGLVITWGMRKPRNFEFELNDTGLVIDSKMYRYREFTSFALSDNSLHFIPKSSVRPRIEIIVPFSREREIREYLLDFLHETEYTESFVEALGHWLRF